MWTEKTIQFWTLRAESDLNLLLTFRWRNWDWKRWCDMFWITNIAGDAIKTHAYTSADSLCLILLYHTAAKETNHPSILYLPIYSSIHLFIQTLSFAFSFLYGCTHSPSSYLIPHSFALLSLTHSLLHSCVSQLYPCKQLPLSLTLNGLIKIEQELSSFSPALAMLTTQCPRTINDHRFLHVVGCRPSWDHPGSCQLNGAPPLLPEGKKHKVTEFQGYGELKQNVLVEIVQDTRAALENNLAALQTTFPF